MREEVKNFDRIDLFNIYNSRENPFVTICTRVDITNIYNKCKNHYASIGYLITLAANQIENFKYRCENGKIYKYKKVRSNFTIKLNDNNIGFFSCDIKENYNDFINEFKNRQNKLLNSNEIENPYGDDGEIWFSCTPWYNFSSIMVPFDKKITIPQFIWDKFTFENDRCYINLFIMAHHGFVDGYHLSLFLDEFNKIVENLDDYLQEK